jgi:Uma2 family endonuclease
MPELEETKRAAELANGPTSPRRRMTEDEFVAWCDEDVRAEWVDGEVIEMSPASTRHNRLFVFLVRLLKDFAERRDLGDVFGPELLIRFSGLRQCRLPDLMFVSKDRLHLLHATHFEGAPDLVMEIVSVESTERDWQQKYVDYQAVGVHEYWVIDPLQKRLGAYALDAAGTYREIPETEGRVSSAVIPGFFLKSEWLWQEHLPAALDALREMGIVP